MITASAFLEGQKAKGIVLPRFNLPAFEGHASPVLFKDCQIIASEPNEVEPGWVLCVGRNEKGSWEILSVHLTDKVIPL